VGFILITIGVFVGFMLTSTMNQELKRTLTSEAEATLRGIEHRVSFLAERINQFSQNQFVINSLIDVEGRNIYLPKLVESFNKTGDLVSTKIVDFMGESILSMGETSGNFSKLIDLRKALDSGKFLITINKSSKTIIMVSPIKFYDTTQGAVISEFNISSILDRTLVKRPFIYYKIEGPNDLSIEENYLKDQSYISVKVDSVDEFDYLRKLKISLEIGESKEFYYARIKETLLNLIGISLIFLALAVFLAFRVGAMISTPILNLCQKIIEGLDKEKKCSPVGTNDELEILASAFDAQTEKLIEAKDHLELRVQERTAEIKNANVKLNQLNEELENEIGLRDKANRLIKDISYQNQLLLSSTEEGILSLDPHGCISFANPAARKILGYGADELNFQFFHSFAYYSIADGAPSIWENTPIYSSLKDGTSIRKDDEIFWKKNGSSFCVEYSCSPILKESIVNGVVISFQNVDERKKIESEIKEAKTAAEKANNAKSNFLANMSHEIRTPMNAILGYAQILTRDSELTSDQKNAAITINKSGNHLLGLINDILDISKIEAGQIEVRNVNFDLIDLVQDLYPMFHLKCTGSGLDLQFNLPSVDLLVVNGDDGKIRQVLINLLGNAVKFTSKGSITFNLTQIEGTNNFVFEILDTGVGIPKESQRSVFEPFKQDEHGFKKGGTGLGLAISKKQVEVMGGQLSLESQVGKGSKFFFTIPLDSTNKEKEFHKKLYENVQSLKKRQNVTALLIDDVKENREVLSSFLSDIDVKVYEADDGLKGLELIKEVKPDIVFLDIFMPGMDGLSVFDKIKSDPENENLKIVCITASAFDQQKIKYLEKGFDYFIAKPFKTDEIFEALAKCLKVEFDYKEEVDCESNKLEESKFVFSEIKVPKVLRDKIIYSAEVCSVTELERHLKELSLNGSECDQFSSFLKSLLKDYDMDSIIKNAKKVTTISD
jgi:PAS domain S-box-containing protein